MPDWPTVFVILLNWNSLDLTQAAIESLQRCSCPAMRIIVVDNASDDGSAEALQAMFPQITVLRNARNLGFAGGNNVGIRYAMANGAEYVLLLNNDTEVAPDFLEHLVAVAHGVPKVAMVCPKIYFLTLPGEIWAAGSNIHIEHLGKLIPRGLDRNLSALLFELRGHHELDRGQWDRLEPVDAAPGCAILVKCSAIEKVGLLDESYFFLHEDSDWSIRMRRAGYQILYMPTSRVWHQVGASTGSPLVVYYSTRNTLWFVRKHGSLAVRLWVYLLSLIILFKNWLIWPWAGERRALVWAKVQATFDFFRSRLGQWSESL